jgi:ribulose-phosphate 3-epimerase
MAVNSFKISPSMMCADFLHLKNTVDLFGEEGIDYLHMDIADGHYVPNFTLGLGICRSLYDYSDIPLDIHLMIENPDDHIQTFSSFTGSILSFHPEMSPEPEATMKRIERAGLRPGIVLKPEIPLEQTVTLFPIAAMVTVMTVHPGFAGQALVPETIEKLAAAAGFLSSKGLQAEVSVDGNVSWKNAPVMRDAGARVFVAGTSSVFSREGSLKHNIRRFRGILSSG